MPGLMWASRGLHRGARETARQGKDSPACAKAPGQRNRACLENFHWLRWGEAGVAADEALGK